MTVGVGRPAKRETALVSYNNLKAWCSDDGVILLVGLTSYDAHLSVAFISPCFHERCLPWFCFYFTKVTFLVV